MTPTDALALTWAGPFTMRELIQPTDQVRHLDGPGVYIWCDGQPRSICYVGKSTSSLIERQRQHYLHQLSMEYTLPGWATSSGKEWACYWHLPEVVSTVLDKQKVLDHIAEAFEYVHQVEVYLAALGAEHVRRVERHLGWELQPTGTKPNTRTPPPTPVPIIHSGADWRTALRADRRDHIIWQ